MLIQKSVLNNFTIFLGQKLLFCFCKTQGIDVTFFGFKNLKLTLSSAVSWLNKVVKIKWKDYLRNVYNFEEDLSI